MASSFDGDPSGLVHRDTYQELTTDGSIENTVAFGIFNKNSFTAALGVEAFGATAMSDITAFGKRAPTGNIIVRKGGSYFSTSIFDKSGTSNYKGRLASYTPALVEGGDEIAYAFHRLSSEQFVPDVDVQDNVGIGRIIDLMSQKMENMKKSVARDFNFSLLGNSSQPDADVLGPSSQNTSLNKALGVTNLTVGGISQAASTDSINYWQPQRKEIASLGSTGEFDSPLLLRRGTKKVMNDAAALAEQQNKYLGVASQGAEQYFDRLFYADAGRRGNNDVLGSKKDYDAAGIRHLMFNGNPMVWDTSVAVPNGATASTESVTWIHLPSYGICFHLQEGFTLDDWEPPRSHDQFRTFVAQFRVRFTPIYLQMRPHAIVYNLPVNAD